MTITQNTVALYRNPLASRVRRVLNLLVPIIVLIVAACGPPQGSNRNNVEIISGEIGGTTYYVPRDYLKLKSRGLADDNIYIQTMYPDFAPLTERPNELWRRGEWYRNVRILANYYEKPAGTQKLAEGNIERLHAHQIVGNEYGLVHRTQPEGYVQDTWDVWLEYSDRDSTEVLSFITCTESSVPQCALHTYSDRFHVKAHFNKMLLPEWKFIKNNVSMMMNSFRDEDSSRQFVINAIERRDRIDDGN